jgi:hypothetical protein
MTEEQLEVFVLQSWEALTVIAEFPPDVSGEVRVGIERNRSLPPSQRMKGLRMAARDLLTMLSELTPEQREQLDGALYGRHEITIGRVRAAVAVDWKRVAEHGLRNDEEYYAAKEVEEEPAAHGADIDPAVLRSLIQRYEDDREANIS